MRFEHEPRLYGEILDARPLGEDWVVLRPDGTVNGRSLDIGELGEDLEFTLSPGGRYAAVTQRFGQFGRVFDLKDGRMVLPLDRGDYYPETTAFPCEFFSYEERPLLVYGSAWNRLDISDPATGELLTGRGPTAYQDGETRPPHYLDYFHAGLHVSSDGRWIAEDGWYWHPLGELRIWSIADWLGGNVWESEDGTSIRGLAQHTYFWDRPLIWLDETRLAFWQNGEDSEGEEVEDETPEIRIYDLREAKEVLKLSGPQVAPSMPWPPKSARKGWIAFDEWLFAISPERGTEVWDLASGARLHHASGYAPHRYHPGRREFLTWEGSKASAGRLVR